MHIGQAGLQIKFNVSFWSPNFSTRVRWPLQNDPHRCFVVIVRRSPPRSGGLRWLKWLRWFRWLDVEHSVRFNEQFLLPSSIGEWFVRAISLKEAKRLPPPPEKHGNEFQNFCWAISMYGQNLVFPTSCKYIYRVKRSRPHIQMYQNSMLVCVCKCMCMVYIYITSHKIGQKIGVHMGKRSPANPPKGLEALWDVVGDDVVAFLRFSTFQLPHFSVKIFRPQIQVFSKSLSTRMVVFM